MKILFYNTNILMGGIEKSIEFLCKELYLKNDIEIVYENKSTLDITVCNMLSKYSTISHIDDKSFFECDICIYCNTYFNYDFVSKKIHSKKKICWIHSKPYEHSNSLLNNNKFISDMNNIICVSNAVKNLLNFQLNTVQVIHNFINPNILELSNEKTENFNSNALKLVVISRLSAGKGFERLLILINELQKNNIQYEVNIIGNGRSYQQTIFDMYANIKNVNFLGKKENPYPYIKKADYLVQLSDYESWCNSITEAKILNVPCIVSSFASASEQIEDDKNGIIIDLNSTDYSIYLNRILKNKVKYKKNLQHFLYKNEINEWEKILHI